MTLTVAMYLTYLLICVPLTIWVATTLGRNGSLFLLDVFAGNADLAAAVNRLLVVGFYLVTLGFMTLFLRASSEVQNLQSLIEQLSAKLGVVMLVLGALHMINVRVFTSMRRRHLDGENQPKAPYFPPNPAFSPNPTFSAVPPTTTR
ncbi:hypothetical protein [Pseudonocardia sp. GCM10023141]|uniref:hypothetical protein n=1 Tax=Pseudonocardia sp. GCM10023141 TaxID=3252653 RepID=UPI003615AC8F